MNVPGSKMGLHRSEMDFAENLAIARIKPIRVIARFSAVVISDLCKPIFDPGTFICEVMEFYEESRAGQLLGGCFYAF